MITGFLDQRIPDVAGDGRGSGTDAAVSSSRLFQVYVPSSYSSERRWPLVLFLHGAGEGGEDGLLATEFQLGSTIRRHADLFQAIAVFPQQRPACYWSAADLDLAVRCLEQTCRSWAIDRQRLLLCGVSSGATAAWRLAAQQPERFAAVLVVGGMVAPTAAIPADQTVAPTEVADPHHWLAERLDGLPVWIHHGDSDPLFPVQDARLIAAALRRQGSAVRYSELPGFGHNVWDVAFYSEAVLRWLLSQRRPGTAPTLSLR